MLYRTDMRVWLLALLLAVQDQPPACTISGTVINAASGAPLNKVELQAERVEDGQIAASATDAKGNFTMVGLAAGKYRLKGMRNGYLDTYYGARRAGGSGTTIVLEAGQEMKDLEWKLFPFGVIAGTVRDADGEPMAGASVKLFRQSYAETGGRKITAEGEGSTDDLGQYRITDLQPGKYFVRAERRSQNEYGSQIPADHSGKSNEPPTVLLPTLYPGVIDPSQARLVEVASGARVTGIDIPLARSRVFRVMVHATAPAGLTTDIVWLDSAPGFEGLGTKLRGQRAAGKEDFEIRGVPAGSYVLFGEADPASKGDHPRVFVFDFYKRRYLARLPLTVSGDMEGVRIAVTKGAEVTGHITIEGAKPKRGEMEVDFLPRNNAEGAARTFVNEDLSFATNLQADRYYVSFEVPNLVVKSMSADGADVFAEDLAVVEGAKETLEIAVTPEGGQVDGVVLDKDDKPVPGATVLLVAEPKLRSRFGSFREAATDQYGRYRFENVRPGDYKLFAWEDVESNSWFDPDFLKDVESRGEPVTLSASGHGTVQLRVLPPR